MNTNTSEKMYNWENKLTQDPCELLAKSRENESIVDYQTFNFYNFGDCAKKMEQLNTVAWEHPNLRFRDGYGIANQCVIDNDNKIRYQSEVTHGPEKRQYYIRNFYAVPDFARGSCAPNTESLLKNGISTSKDRECDRLSEKNFNRFTPYTDCFGRFMDQGARVIPEMSTIGLNSSDIVRRTMSQQNKCVLEK